MVLASASMRRAMVRQVSEREANFSLSQAATRREKSRAPIAAAIDTATTIAGLVPDSFCACAVTSSGQLTRDRTLCEAYPTADKSEPYWWAAANEYQSTT